MVGFKELCDISAGPKQDLIQPTRMTIHKATHIVYLHVHTQGNIIWETLKPGIWNSRIMEQFKQCYLCIVIFNALQFTNIMFDANINTYNVV